MSTHKDKIAALKAEESQATNAARRRPYRPFLLMAAGVAVLALMDYASDLIARDVAAAQILFFRSLVVLLCAAAWVAYKRQTRRIVQYAVRFRFPIWHLVQGVFFLISGYAFICAIRGEGQVLSYFVSFLSPAWLIATNLGLRAFGALEYKSPDRSVIFGIVLAFAGVALGALSREGLAYGSFIWALVAGASYGAELAFTAKAEDTHGSAPAESLFYTALVATVLSGAWMLVGNVSLQFNGSIAAIAGTGVLSAFATGLMFAAISLGKRQKPVIDADRLAPLDYSILVFGALFELASCSLAGDAKACSMLAATNWLLFAAGTIVLAGGLAVIIWKALESGSDSRSRKD